MDKLDEVGLSSYEDEDIPNSDWYVRKCPRWANQGCFRGNQIWQEGPNQFYFQIITLLSNHSKNYSNNVLQGADSAIHSIKDVLCFHWTSKKTHATILEHQMFVNHFVEAVFATRVDSMMVTNPARLSNVTSVLRFGTIWENEFQIKIKMTITVMN